MNLGISVNEEGPAASEATEAVFLSDTEKDTLGEISNICMGTSATTLSELLGKRVVITTPKVSICRGSEYLEEYRKPVIAAEVFYTQGLNGKNVLLLKKEDALLITGLLMGGGQTEESIGDMYLSATSEVMNQMIGSSSTALADILHMSVNISPPVTTEFSREDQVLESIFDNQVLIRISFRMEIEGLLVSNIMQMMPVDFAKKLADSLLNGNGPEPAKNMAAAEAPGSKDKGSKGIVKEEPAPKMSAGEAVHVKNTQDTAERKPMELKAVKFQSFEEEGSGILEKAGQQNIDLIIDVPLQVTVVLGKSKKSIREILDFGIGSVVVLDRLAGEMVDVLVNGKAFARGEVVVIDDNYGIRITEMIPGKMKM